MSDQIPSHPTPADPGTPPGDFQIALTGEEGLGRIRVNLESFVALNIWMSRELDAIEKRHINFQTPGMPSGRSSL